MGNLEFELDLFYKSFCVTNMFYYVSKLLTNPDGKSA